MLNALCRTTYFVCSLLNCRFVMLHMCFIWLLILYSVSDMVALFARYGALWLILFSQLMKNLVGKVCVGVETMKHNRM